MHATTLAVDLAKSVFQVAIARNDRSVEQRRLSRAQFETLLHTTAPARIVMEACGTAHHWGRIAARLGHLPVLLHPGYVRPYVRRNKTDAADALALLRAVEDADLRPVVVKSEAQQTLQALHRIRSHWMAQRIAAANSLRGLLAEFGIVVTLRRTDRDRHLRQAVEEAPPALHVTMNAMIDDMQRLDAQVAAIDRQLAQTAYEQPDAVRLLSIPGVGVVSATALLGTVADIRAFPRARAFASWLGLTPREHSSGATRRLGSITKRGDTYLRMLLTHCARSALLAAQRAAHTGKTLTPLQRWALQLRSRCAHNVATLALANKMARIVWAIWTKAIPYRGGDLTAAA